MSENITEWLGTSLQFLLFFFSYIFNLWVHRTGTLYLIRNIIKILLRRHWSALLLREIRCVMRPGRLPLTCSMSTDKISFPWKGSVMCYYCCFYERSIICVLFIIFSMCIEKSDSFGINRLHLPPWTWCSWQKEKQSHHSIREIKSRVTFRSFTWKFG